MAMKDKTTTPLDTATKHNLTLWLNGKYDEQTKASIRRLLEEDPSEIINAFYTHLAFGTGGLRGIMGIGCNRMNVYTVAAAAQGLANYINLQTKPTEGYAVAIGYDSRHHSKEFAEQAALVLAGNGINVFIFKDLRPTPLLSFTCRLKKCISAIMITASHNPPEYNGFKVFWDDGAQILPPHDKNIISKVHQITDPAQVAKASSIQHPLIHWIGSEMDEAYIKAIAPLQNYPKENKKEGHRLRIAYTSLHGTGITMVPKALKSWGFDNIVLVEEQINPDGNFPTVHSPNPEFAPALKMGIDTLEKSQADILIATDPDCDRMGLCVRHQNKVYNLSGNQIACICLHHLCESLTEHKKMPPKAAFIKTVVTSELFQAICDDYKRPCFNVLTGFKYIAEKIRDWENDPNGYEFVFGGEDSNGYLLGTHVRDKDGIISSTLVSEAALKAKLNSETFIDILEKLYKKYGCYYEQQYSILFDETKQGRAVMEESINQIKTNAPKTIAGISVSIIEDYENLTKTNLQIGKVETILLPKTPLIILWLEDSSKLCIRPSGTEPKIKIYCGVLLKVHNESFDEMQSLAEGHAQSLIKDLASHLKI